MKSGFPSQPRLPARTPDRHQIYNASRFLVAFVVALWILNACRPAQVVSSPTSPASSDIVTSAAPSQTPIPNPTLTQVPASTPTMTHEPAPVRIWIEPGLDNLFAESWSPPPGSILVAEEALADIKLQVGQGQLLGTRFFLVVTAFPSTRDELGIEVLEQAWSEGNLGGIAGKPILLNQDTAGILNIWLGPYHPAGIKILETQQALNEVWQDRSSLAIIPFEALQPRWKVLNLDGQNPLHKDFTLKAYPLAVPIGFTALSDLPVDESILTQLEPFLTNFNPGKLTNVTLTGVTALVRGTALTMDARGITYPALDIRQVLQEADILHISNEIPFYSQCPEPELYPAEIKFCSSPAYIQLLEDIGTDIVELDGDHFGDYGIQAMQETLKMYQERGWPYYGGGANSTEARQPVLLTHNGNQIAFIGCNAKGIDYYASADEVTPGAVQCDFDWLTGEISRLDEAGYKVITTFQHNEYYRYQAQPDLVRDFQKAAQAGAVIVSGSQAHQPHGMEFFQDSFIHYGLGNLFFDQYRFFPGPELDRAFIDRHYFYDQHYISTELLTIKFIDLARSRLATPDERLKFLQEIFTASGW